MNMKRIRSKIEEGNLTEKKLEHREPKCQTKQKPNKNYVLPNKVIYVLPNKILTFSFVKLTHSTQGFREQVFKGPKIRRCC
jgi:hypothetical protein